MPQIDLAFEHRLGAAEAKERIVQYARRARRDPGPLVSDIQESWSADTGTFDIRVLAMTLHGTVKIEPARVLVQLQFPAAALPFKAQIEREIQAKGTELLADASGSTGPA